ncbi:MAG: hypothetical protein LQ350_002184 [Teloschistes chrysophthalmus]|nr:MAG: hypothetical protein LQ350_002184 [Niorma chrysophthalma]
MPGLQFNEPLSWRVGKPIPVAELLRRLQSLSKEMKEMDQEEEHRDSFTKVARELVNHNLIAHKDKGVKALTASCLVDILRLCAPDAPYTGQQLRDTFNLIITQILPALADPSNAYNTQHLYVLSSLAAVKSILLLSDIPSADILLKNVFQICFDVLSGSSRSMQGDKLTKDVEMNMTAMLVTLVDESATIPPEAVDIIVAQFLRTDPKAMSGSTSKNKKNGVVDEKQSTLTLRQLPPAYNMAKYICNAVPERMARHFSQYFNDVIVDASTASKEKAPRKSKKRHSDGADDSDDDLAGPTEEDLKELRKVHGLLRELWRACPGVLQNVIPQLEAELSAENIQLRLLATETFGDIVSGIGAAGLPAPPTLDPAAYPSNALSDPSENTVSLNLLTTPSSPLPFISAHPQAYSSYLGRKHDKSPLIRAAWTTGIGRILATSAGGAGLSQQDEDRLISDLCRMLADVDDKVRVAAVRVVASFNFRDIVSKLGRAGGVTETGTVLSTLADRARDRKHLIREEAMILLARIWGVAVGELSAGNEQISTLVGGIPSKILNTFFTNDNEIVALLDRVFFEQLLPLRYPSVKAKGSKITNGHSQNSGANTEETMDPDKIRTERILLLARDLDERAKKVFYTMQARQQVLYKNMTGYLMRCENYNEYMLGADRRQGGVVEGSESDVKKSLTGIIQTFANWLPNPSQASADLWKFAKMHDRRSYQLIRFCMAPDSDYRTMIRAMKEFNKRITDSPSSMAASSGLRETLMPLIYRVSLIVYNKSHVPAIMHFSRTDEKSLAATAHEMLRDISSITPEVLKAHVQEICKTLQDEAPSAQKTNEAGAVDNLKACASFAAKYPDEIPKDRKFVQAMASYALHGSPPEVAKYAVSVIWAASDKKEMLVRDLAQNCTEGFGYGKEGFLARLATLSQLVLLAPNELDEEHTDAIIDIAIKQVLLQVRQPSTQPADAYEWSSTIDTEAQAKCWALKILINRIRSHPEIETLPEVAAPVYSLLFKLIDQVGEISPASNTPPTHRSRLRLLAARLYLKLCTSKSHDALLTPSAFNVLATVVQDSETPVRVGFLHRLKKYLNAQKLPQRFYTIPFLLAFEPNETLRSDTVTWIKSRATVFSSVKAQSSSSKASIVMESTFARLLSMLCHHPDYNSGAEDLVDFARYIIFYLQNVATEDNLSLIYHIAQRVKQCRDAISAVGSAEPGATSASEADDRLYHLSDLAQITIRKFEDLHNWTIQALPGRIRLPSTLFTEVKSHTEAQRIAERNYLPESVEAGVEDLLKAMVRAAKGMGKKRKSEGDHHADGRDAKRSKAGLPVRKASGPKVVKGKKSASSKVAKTPKPKSKKKAEDADPGSGERRRSGRVKEVEKSYAERDSDEDDEEMQMMEAAAGEEVAAAEETDSASEDRGSVNENLVEAGGQEEDEDQFADEFDELGEEGKKDEAAAEEDEEPAPKMMTPVKSKKKQPSVSPRAKKPPPKSKPRQTTSRRAATRGKANAKKNTYHDDDDDDDDELLSDPPGSK